MAENINKISKTYPSGLFQILKRVITRIAQFLFVLVTFTVLVTRSNVPPGDSIERVRVYTRPIEFDYIAWTLNAFEVKVVQSSLGTYHYMPESARHKTMIEYLILVADIEQSEAKLNDIYSDPNIPDPKEASLDLRQHLSQLYAQRSQLAPLAEAILQDEVGQVVADDGLTLGNQPIPAILYHVTPLPMALIISPRNTIEQEADISLIPDLPVDQQAALEEKVDKAMNVSSLVVPVGGIGVYPTMVMETTDLTWQAGTVAHEWIHNFLTLRPLGIRYEDSAELRTMNETTASIAGNEIGNEVIQRYYPELLPAPQPAAPQSSVKPAEPPKPPPFDFRAEMRITRVKVDELLAAGKISEAESYMEQRRRVFWDHGYHIRKLNQAYFAFYGAYEDQPGGAAGEDPVGAAVRKLRSQSPTLADFLYRIAWMTSFDDLKRAVSEK